MFSSFMEPGVSPVLFWAFAGIAVIIQGISKSGFAGGAGILSLPLLMLVMPVQKVAAALLPLLILCDLNAVYHHRHNKLWRPILRLYVPSIVGIALGGLVWWWIGRQGVAFYSPHIKRFVGVIAILFALYIIGREAAMDWVHRFRPGPAAACVAGVSAGFCSTIVHAAGPIVNLYLFTQDLGKSLFVGTVAWTFTLINLTKLPVYYGIGLIDTEVLLFDLTLVALIPLGSSLGKWMYHRVSETLFNRIIFVLTLISGLQLLINP